MHNILQLAQAWLEHCREEADLFYMEGDVDIADVWMTNADDAERIIKRYIDARRYV